MALKQGQGHQTWDELLDPKQSNNHTEFERAPLNCVPQKAKVEILSNQKTHQLSPLIFVAK